ncbi:FecCD family ABC transporter permease [Bacillus cereus]|uniref:FecCD family ABC transporter permease n=1 Tax=Bacillus cereus TaxID=1396 RepID=UPI003980CADB
MKTTNVNHRKKLSITFTALLALLIIASLLSLGAGAIWISPIDIIQCLFTGEPTSVKNILITFRLPRYFIAILAGIGLSISGAILQGILKNPLASPDVIGVSKGAGLSAAIVILLFPSAPAYTLPIFAFIGAMLVTVCLYLFARGNKLKTSTLALVGVALSALCQAGLQLLMVKFPVQINTALAWLAGSLWGRQWDHVYQLLPWIVALVPLVMYFSIRIEVLSLGDELATGLGANVDRTRMLLLFLSALLVAATVATVGTIGFVGLIAPHIARRLVGGKYYVLLPASALIGIIVLLLADTLGKGLVPPLEIPAGVFTALIGGPYFVWLLARSKK